MTRKPKKFKVLLVGGGSGGHMYPLVAVAKELNKLTIHAGMNPDMRYFGFAGPFRSYLQIAGIRIVRIVSSKWRRYFSVLNFLDLFKFAFGFSQSLWKLYWFMPHVCFSKGGPGALPIILAARFYFIPVVIHESDAIPGLTNRFSASGARAIELSFPEARDFFPPNKQFHIVGNPIREELMESMTESSAKQEFGFREDLPIILFTGGSLGSERMNSFVLEQILKLIEKYQIIHQVGLGNYEDYKNEFEFVHNKPSDDLKARYKFFPYFDTNLTSAYHAADLVISRAGASTIFETAMFGKPSILIPLPESANNHQVTNAYAYQKVGAASVIEEKNFLPSIVMNEINNVLKDNIRLSTMKAAAEKFARKDAALLIARNIMIILRL